MAVIEAATPSTETDPPPPSSIVATPAIPMAAPASGTARGRSAISAQAISISAIGEAAMIVAAMLVGSCCAAR